jgi:uncharacterized protein YecE (DUF72 family)
MTRVRAAGIGTGLRSALCQQLGPIHAVDPFQRPSIWGEPAYYRLHGDGSVRSSYSEADVAELERRLAPGPAYVLFNDITRWDDARCPSPNLIRQRNG